uniref:COX assembly mitochondrial protein n=1 Tax=Globodera rostochiensis TaxID=31243 RepID=A0A914I526_GLORO
MHPTQTLQKISKPLQPRKCQFFERIPLMGKNHLAVVSEKLHGLHPCVEERHDMFACLKKWDMDNLKCTEFSDALMHCMEANLKIVGAYKEMKAKGEQRLHIADEASSVKTLASRLLQADIDRLFRKYKQPDLGTIQTKVMKRLPHQEYYEDLFNRKTKKGWRA